RSAWPGCSRSAWPRRPGPVPAGRAARPPAPSAGWWCNRPARPWPWQGMGRPATSSVRLPLLRRRAASTCAFVLVTDWFGPIGLVDLATAFGLHGDRFGGDGQQLAAVG